MASTFTMRHPRWRWRLIVLAVGSVLAGFVGVPHALGGSNRIEAFLEPSFEAHRTAVGEFGSTESRAVEPVRRAEAHAEAPPTDRAPN